MRWILVYVAVAAAANGISLAASATAPAQQPSTATLINDLRKGDKAIIDAAVEAIRSMVANRHAPDALWKNWLPQLMRDKRYQDTVALCELGAQKTPYPGAIAPFMLYRTLALDELQKPQEALASAKSYYNVCDIKDTAGAVKVMSDALKNATPDDASIGQRFIEQQARASRGGGQASDAGMLAGIKIDRGVYDDAINEWATKTTRFSDRICYGNLLLVADRGEEAEKLFRRLYEIAGTQAELTAAAEGLARSLRAEDGNMGRANAWLGALAGGSAPASK